MPLVAALLERRPAVAAFRKALSKTSPRTVVCRSPAHLDRLLLTQLVDLVVLGPTVAKGPVLGALRREYPTLPLMLYAPLRSDDADLLSQLHHHRLVALSIEGMDEPLLAARVSSHGLTARRVRVLGPLAVALQLQDRLQQEAWHIIVRDAPSGLTTEKLAKILKITRETLSRRFSAGGAPQLKRAIDAVRLFAAGQLLANPAYRVTEIARLLKFSSASLLQATARRTFGVSARGVLALSDDEWVRGLIADGQRGDWE